MNINLNFQNKLYTILLLVAIAAGTYVGIVIANRFEVLAKGMLGGAALVLTRFLFIPPKKFLITKPVELPRDLKYIPAGFFLSIIVFLSVVYAAEALIYYIKLMF